MRGLSRTSFIKSIPAQSADRFLFQWKDFGSYRRRFACNGLQTGSSTFPAALNDLATGPGARSNAEDQGRSLNVCIGPNLHLIEQALEVGGHEMKLHVPSSTEAVMDYYIDAGNVDGDPYWCRPWPSALALAQLLLRRPDLVRRKNVCELGAGLGIASIASAIAGCEKVVMTDKEPLALECALRSAEASGVDAYLDLLELCSDPSPSAQVSACLLDWTQSEPQISRFDCILACDVLYEKQAAQPIAELIPKLLSTRGGQFILADPEARTRVHRQDFTELLLQNRHHPMRLDLSETVVVAMDGIDTSVQLMIFRSNTFNDTIGLKP